MKLSMIVAIGKNGEIGQGGKMPWPHLKRDMAWFVEKTKDKPVIMGRRTWESLPSRPLAGRGNYILSRSRDPNWSSDHTEPDDPSTSVAVYHSPAVLASRLEHKLGVDEAVVIGGAKVYEAFLPWAATIYLTKIDRDYPDADTFFPFPLFESEWTETPAYDHWFVSNGVRLGFYTFTRK